MVVVKALLAAAKTATVPTIKPVLTVPARIVAGAPAVAAVKISAIAAIKAQNNAGGFSNGFVETTAVGTMIPPRRIIRNVKITKVVI